MPYHPSPNELRHHRAAIDILLELQEQSPCTGMSHSDSRDLLSQLLLQLDDAGLLISARERRLTLQAGKS